MCVYSRVVGSRLERDLQEKDVCASYVVGSRLERDVREICGRVLVCGGISAGERSVRGGGQHCHGARTLRPTTLLFPRCACDTRLWPPRPLDRSSVFALTHPRRSIPQWRLLMGSPPRRSTPSSVPLPQVARSASFILPDDRSIRRAVSQRRHRPPPLCFVPSVPERFTTAPSADHETTARMSLVRTTMNLVPSALVSSVPEYR